MALLPPARGVRRRGAGRGRLAPARRRGPMRRRWPLWRVRTSLLVVSRREDVDEVIDGPDGCVFAYASHLPGEFLLASGPAEHRRQRAELDAVLRRGEADRLRLLVAREA